MISQFSASVFSKNFELLGSPIGDKEFCTSFITKFVSKRVIHTLDALHGVKDAQVFHSLVRLTSSLCKVVHLLRTVPPCFCKNALSFFDSSIRSAFSLGTGILFDDSSWTQVCLPFRLGGFGLRSAVAHSAGAYLASVSVAARLDGWNVALATGWDDALVDFFHFSNTDSSFFSDSLPLKQRALSEKIDDFSFASLLSRSCPRDKARLMAVSSEGASSWLGVIPSAGLNQVLESREFCILLRFWCGQKLSPESSCPFCFQGMDEFGYHALTCKKGGCLGVRHNALREGFLHFCKVAGISDAGREVPGLIDGSNARPADVLLPPSGLVLPDATSSKYNCLDFAVTHTLQYLSTSADVSAGAAAKKYEDGVKFPRYLDDCKRNDLLFTPMVVEVFGAWGPASADVFEFVSKAAAFAKRRDPDIALTQVRRALSFALQRQNAISLLKHVASSSPCLFGAVPGPTVRSSDEPSMLSPCPSTPSPPTFPPQKQKHTQKQKAPLPLLSTPAPPVNHVPRVDPVASPPAATTLMASMSACCVTNFTVLPRSKLFCSTPPTGRLSCLL